MTRMPTQQVSACCPVCGASVAFEVRVTRVDSSHVDHELTLYLSTTRAVHTCQAASSVQDAPSPTELEKYRMILLRVANLCHTAPVSSTLAGRTVSVEAILKAIQWEDSQP